MAEENLLLEDLYETVNISLLFHKETKEQIIIRSIPLWFCKFDNEGKEEFIEELKTLKINDFSEENSYYPSFLQIISTSIYLNNIHTFLS